MWREFIFTVALLGATAPASQIVAACRDPAQSGSKYVFSVKDCTNLVAMRLDHWRRKGELVETRCGTAGPGSADPVLDCEARGWSPCIRLSELNSFDPETRENAQCLAAQLRGVPPALVFGASTIPFPGLRHTYQ